MATIEDLKKEVLDAVDQDGKEALEAKEASLDKQLESERQKRLSQLEEEKTRLTNLQERQLTQEIRNYENQLRNQYLKKSQQRLKGLYVKASKRLTLLAEGDFYKMVEGVLNQIPDQEESTLILGEQSDAQWSKESEKRLKKEFPWVKVSKEKLAHKGGFVVSQEQADYNYTFEAIVDSLSANLSRQLNKKLDE